MESIKRLLPLTEVRNINTDERTVEFVISDETPDRHRTVLPINMWNLDNYRANPIVKYMHSDGDTLTNTPDPDFIIGTSELRIEDSKLIGTVRFEDADLNPLADKLFRKIQFGTLRMSSVGFIPPAKGWRKGDSTRGENESNI